jgi:NADH-quinone oxidoreductase subunit J
LILFWLLAVGLIASAIFTITQKSPVYSVVGLLANFLVLAALYFSLDAEFLGIIQIVVYSGAILMLFVFVIALLSSGIGPFSEGPNRLPHIAVPAILAVFAGFCAVAYAIVRGPLSPTMLASHPAGSELGDVGLPNVFGSVSDFGQALFTVHLLPFEVTAFILMVAVVGVVAIAGDAAPARNRGHHAAGRRPAREREAIVKAKAR